MWPIFVSPGLLLHAIKKYFIANGLFLPIGNIKFDFRRKRNCKSVLVSVSDGTRLLHIQSYSKPYVLVKPGRASA